MNKAPKFPTKPYMLDSKPSETVRSYKKCDIELQLYSFDYDIDYSGDNEELKCVSMSGEDFQKIATKLISLSVELEKIKSYTINILKSFNWSGLEG